MTEAVNPKRTYNSPRRREQAAATRRADPRRRPAAVRAAGLRGDDDGRRSRPRPGVALKTVYLAFETKSGSCCRRSGT